MSGGCLRKAVFIVIFSLAALMIAAAIVPIFIPTETYRNFVEKRLSRDFDVRVTMEGFRFRLIPYPGYSIRGLGFISTKEPFRGQRVLWVKKATGSLSMGSFLGDKLSTSVKLKGLEMDIRQSEKDSNISAMLGIRSKGVDDGTVDDLKTISIENIEVTRGRLNIYSEESAQPRIIDNIEIVAKNLRPASGIGTEIRMTGSVLDKQRPDFSFSGQVFYDPARHELSARNINAYLAGSRFALDLSMNFGVSPYSFDMHLATPSLTRETVQPFLEKSSLALRKNLSWQGQLVADLSMRGTRDAFDVKLQLDATQAKFDIGESFLKGAGLPLKFVSSFYVQEKNVSIRDSSIIFGTDEVSVSGDIARDDNLSSKLMVRAKALNTSSLKTFFPSLKIFGETEGLGIKLSARGELTGDEALDIFGTFQGDRIGFAGASLSDVTGAFSRAEDGIVFDTIRGQFAGGQMSGNGRMLSGDENAYHFDLVVNRMEAAELSLLSGAITGQSSLVIEADGTGTNADKVTDTLELGGSFIMKSGTLKAYEAIGSIFDEETNVAVRAQAGAGFDEAWMAKLQDLGDGVEELRATFEYSDGKLTVEKLLWKNPIYSADLELNVGDGGALSGGGDIILPGAIAKKLITDEAARKLLFDRKGSFSIPVNIMGRISDARLDLDLVKLDETIADDVKRSELVGEPAKVVRKKEAPDASKKEAPKTVAKPARRKAPTRRRSKRPPSRRESTVDPDDILKVIIGR
jgi:hypothetical protein